MSVTLTQGRRLEGGYSFAWPQHPTRMSTRGVRRDARLLFGLVAAVVLAAGILGLALMVPGYSQVRQTVSEIGDVGSAAQVPFSVMLFVVAAALLVFAWGMRDAAIRFGHSPVAAYLVACAAISAAGVGAFPFPHPLHNVFGMSELVGYQAPLLLALGWRHDPRVKNVVIASWVGFVIVWAAILMNLSTLDPHGALWLYERPFYGLVQRALFAVWFAWCTVAGILLFNASRTSVEAVS